MSRADQIARQQARAFAKLHDGIPSTVSIGGTDYDVALAPGTQVQENDEGVATYPNSIGFWLRKSDYANKPALKTPVTWEGVKYYVSSVDGLGAMHQNWKVDAGRFA